VRGGLAGGELDGESDCASTVSGMVTGRGEGLKGWMGEELQVDVVKVYDIRNCSGSTQHDKLQRSRPHRVTLSPLQPFTLSAPRLVTPSPAHPLTSSLQPIHPRRRQIDLAAGDRLGTAQEARY